MDKVVEKPAQKIEEDLSDGRFGWAWLFTDGSICGYCRSQQPQSKETCLQKHSPTNVSERLRAILKPGVAIPWSAQ